MYQLKAQSAGSPLPKFNNEISVREARILFSTPHTITCELQATAELAEEIYTLHSREQVCLPAAAYLPTLPQTSAQTTCTFIHRHSYLEIYMDNGSERFSILICPDVLVDTSIFSQKTFGNSLISKNPQQFLATGNSLYQEKAASQSPEFFAKDKILEHMWLNLQEHYKAYQSGIEATGDIVLGLGYGLTPSSDDFWLGAMAVFSIVDSCFCAYLREKILRNLNKTNKISAHYLRLALHGYYSSLVMGVIFADVERQQQTISELLDYGHHSGSDTIYGIFSALTFHLSSHCVKMS